MTTAPRQVQLLVCGNIDRGDDGAAIQATREIANGSAVAGPDDFAVHRCGGLDIVDLLKLPAGTRVVIADTATGIAPGEVVTLTFEQVLANPHGPTPHSSHALPIELVIGVANALNGAPLDGLFVGIGGSDFGYGATPSLEVLRALPKFTTAIKAALRRLATSPAAVGA